MHTGLCPNVYVVVVYIFGPRGAKETRNLVDIINNESKYCGPHAKTRDVPHFDCVHISPILGTHAVTSRS